MEYDLGTIKQSKLKLLENFPKKAKLRTTLLLANILKLPPQVLSSNRVLLYAYLDTMDAVSARK